VCSTGLSRPEKPISRISAALLPLHLLAFIVQRFGTRTLGVVRHEASQTRSLPVSKYVRRLTGQSTVRSHYGIHQTSPVVSNPVRHTRRRKRVSRFRSPRRIMGRRPGPLHYGAPVMKDSLAAKQPRTDSTPRPPPPAVTRNKLLLRLILYSYPVPQVALSAAISMSICASVRPSKASPGEPLTSEAQATHKTAYISTCHATS
jgi:hypothetical protein